MEIQKKEINEGDPMVLIVCLDLNPLAWERLQRCEHFLFLLAKAAELVKI